MEEKVKLKAAAEVMVRLNNRSGAITKSRGGVAITRSWQKISKEKIGEARYWDIIRCPAVDAKAVCGKSTSDGEESGQRVSRRRRNT